MNCLNCKNPFAVESDDANGRDKKLFGLRFYGL